MEEQITKLLDKLNGLIDVIPQAYEVVRKQYIIHEVLNNLLGAIILCAVCIGGAIVLYMFREASVSKQLHRKPLRTVKLETIDDEVYYYTHNVVGDRHIKLYVTKDEEDFQFYTRNEDGQFIKYKDKFTQRINEPEHSEWLGYISNYEARVDFEDDYNLAKKYNACQTEHKKVKGRLVILTIVLITLAVLGIGLFVADAYLAPDINFLEYLGGK